MEKKTLVYKRRPRKPLSDLPANEAGIEDCPRSRPSLAASESHGSKSVNVEKHTRKSWIDRSLSNKGRRSSVSLGEGLNHPRMAYKWVGTLFKSREKNQPKRADGHLRNQPTKKLFVISRSRKVNPPVDFVKEKQAQFAEIDSFDLESEEESPVSKARPEEWTKEHSDVSPELYSHRCGLDIVPEDEFQEFSDCLSDALLTPHSVRKRDDSGKEFLQSPGLQSGSAQLSSKSRKSQNSLTDSESSSKSGSWNSPNTRSDFEDYSSPLTSPAIDEPAVNNYVSEEEVPSLRSPLSVGFQEGRSPSASEKRPSLDCNLLIPGLSSLHIGEINGQDLSPFVEEDEEEHSKLIDEGSICTDFFPGCRKISLETSAEEPLPVFKALLEECHQTWPLSLRDAISDFCDLSEMVKLGEGTFGEAFKGGGCVFKIVPMDGDFLVNAEIQKTSAEVYSEVLLTNTLSRLRGLDSQDSIKCANYCTNFIETKAIRICQGSYEMELCLAWEEWDAIRSSDNDHPMIFPQHQLYVVFVLADGGKDLESFVLSTFKEVRSLLLQVVLALAVAEEGCGFEHRDLHWGNIVLARDHGCTCGYYRLCNEVLKVETAGLSVSIIDFTLSRIQTGNHVFFCNLSADPALFEGPSSDTQADTYRRMLSVTKGNWEGSFPQTNCHWIHYVADILVKKKSYQCSSQQKRALRSFSKRVLLYESAKAAVCDSFFQDMWIKGCESPGTKDQY